MPNGTASPQEPPGPKAVDPVVEAGAALKEEFDHLGLGADGGGHALCLSGGGVRSAAFCLGVIQALARHRLLTHFHYLSTVSGGGYIGGWLTRLIAQRYEPPAEGSDEAARRRDLETRIDTLQEDIAAPLDRVEKAVVGGLRRYSSYLTPNRGFTSLDTWAGITLWMRNTLINWLVFVPVFAALTGLPIVYVASVYALASGTPELLPGPAAHAAYVGIAFLFVAVVGTIIYLPSHAHPDSDHGRRDAYGLSGTGITARIVLPLIAWCLLAASSVATKGDGRGDGSDWERGGRAVFERQVAGDPACPAQPCRCPPASAAEACPAATPRANASPLSWTDPCLRLPALSFATCILAYFASLLRIAWKFRSSGEALRRHTDPFVNGIIPWILACAVSSLFLGLGIWFQTGRDLFWIALVGPLWVAIAETLRSTVYVAMRHSGLRSDSDREWLARVNASKLRFMTGLAAGGSVIVLGGTQLAAQSDAVWSWLVGGGAASGSAVAVLGRSARSAFSSQTAAPTGSRVGAGGRGTALLIDVAIVLFGAALLIVVGRGFGLLAGVIGAIASGDPRPDFRVLAATSLGLVALSVAIAAGLGRWINLNHFSMHAVYRNRLIRAFLGSGRTWADRRPDRFTQFDPRDNIRLADTVTGRPFGFLFPVVNVALNRTTGRDTARAERKAESFTMTPFRCGAATLPGPGGARAGVGAYAPTQGYACAERDTGPGDQERGVTLGTAITISGAAASPNMGYHSSPLIAFVMTLFNVRLGAWLPNPALRSSSDRGRARVLRESGPTNEVPTLLNELCGRSDNNSDFLYLSDGGHFDNLGVYEMLRRRCKLIVAVDAGQDKGYAYEDLGRLKQNARIDLGVEIDFIRQIEMKQQMLSPQGALAKIRYPDLGQGLSEGRMLYLKSWLPREAPVELQAFQLRNIDFPHQSTGNQFFTESEFESYRLLGNYIARTILDHTTPEAGMPRAADPDELDRIFRELERAG